MIGRQVLTARNRRQISFHLPDELADQIDDAMDKLPVRPTISAFCEEMIRRGLATLQKDGGSQ